MSDETEAPTPEAPPVIDLGPEEPEPIEEVTAVLSFTRTADDKNVLRIEMLGDRYEAQRLIIGAMRSWSPVSERERIIEVIQAVVNGMMAVLPSVLGQKHEPEVVGRSAPPPQYWAPGPPRAGWPPGPDAPPPPPPAEPA